MISSTRSSESASRSSWNEASSVMSFASTPSCSTSTSLTLSATSSREAAISLSYLPFSLGPSGTADATTLPRGRRNLFFEACANALDDVSGRTLRAEGDRVGNRRSRAGAVGDDYETSQPQQIGAAVGIRVEPLAQAARGGTDEEASEFPARARLDLLSELVEERLDRPFHELERHVAREAVADDHVGCVREQLAALDVADEVEMARLENRMRLADEAVPLLRLLADGEERDVRVSDAQDLLGEDGAHVPELDEGLRASPRISWEKTDPLGRKGRGSSGRASAFAPASISPDVPPMDGSGTAIAGR